LDVATDATAKLSFKILNILLFTLGTQNLYRKKQIVERSRKNVRKNVIYKAKTFGCKISSKTRVGKHFKV